MKTMKSVTDLRTATRDKVYKSNRNALKHLIASQADMIDVCLTDRMTFNEIIEHCAISATRLKSHLRHLISERDDTELLIDDEHRMTFKCAQIENEQRELIKAAHVYDASSERKNAALTKRVMKAARKSA